MNTDAIALLAESDRQALADRLALELMRPIPEWMPVDQSILLPVNRFQLPPAPPPEQEERPTRPVGPSSSRLSRSLRRKPEKPTAAIEGAPDGIRATPFVTGRAPRNSPTPFERGAFDAQSTIERAAEAL